MNRRQRKKQIKQKIENNEVISVSDYRFIEKHCPELQKVVLKHNIQKIKEAAFNIGAAVARALKEITPLFQKVANDMSEALRKAAEPESEGDDETQE